jgi:hypothetical protein
MILGGDFCCYLWFIFWEKLEFLFFLSAKWYFYTNRYFYKINNLEIKIHYTMVIKTPCMYVKGYAFKILLYNMYLINYGLNY